MPPCCNSATLQSALDAALVEVGVDEEASLAAGRLVRSEPIRLELDAGCSPSHKLVLAELKACGVAKLGIRHKVATALLTRLKPAPMGTSAVGIDPDRALPADTSAGDEFWAQVSKMSCQVTEPLGLPSSLHVSPGQVAMAQQHANESEQPVRTTVTSVTSAYPEPLPRLAPNEPQEATETASPTIPATTAGNVPRVEPVVAFDERPASERVMILRQCGRESYARGEIASAESFFLKALELEPQNTDLHANLAACALAGQVPRPNLALRRLAPALRLSPTHFKARMRAGRSLLLLGRLEEARDAFATAAQSGESSADDAPPDRIVSASCSSSGPLALVEVADVPMGSAKRQAVDECCVVRRLIGSVERARALSNSGRGEEALVLAREVAAACPCSSIGGQLIVAALEATGRLADAEMEAERMMKVSKVALAEAAAAADGEAGPEAQGDFEKAVEVMARVVCRTGDVGRAVQILVEHAGYVQSETPQNNGEGPVTSGCASRDADKIGGAACGAFMSDDRGGADVGGRRCDGLQQILRTLREALRLKAEGNARYAAGDFEEAINNYTSALEVDAAGMLRPALLGNRGQAQLRAGRPVRALHDIEEALRLDAASAKLLLRRAACRLAMEQGEEAEADYRRALQLDPSCEAARQALAGIDGSGPVVRPAFTSSEAAEWAAGTRRTPPPPPSGGLDAYAELGLTPQATHSQVKAAFRRLALSLHPDKFRGDDAGRAAAQERYERVQLAYNVLADNFKRWLLDAGQGATSLAEIEAQERADAEFAYYATSAPNGYVRGDTAGKTGGRVYNPFQKPSANFELDPCRVGAPPSAPGVIDKTAAPAVIRLKASATALPLKHGASRSS